MKRILSVLFAFVVTALAAAPDAAIEEKEAPALNWDAAPVDIVLQTYGEQVGKTILKDPGVPGATITLKSREGQRLTKEEYLEAIAVVLEMNGIHLEPYGENFIRAVPRGKVRKEGIPLYMDIKDVPPSTKDGVVVSVMMMFKNIATDEAQKALEGLKSDTGTLLVYERTNAILVTDTWQNLKRMNEVAAAIDIASPVLENVFVRQIQNAVASDIQQHLQKIVEESMKEQEKNGKGVQNAVNQPVRPLTGSRLLNRSGAQNEPKPVEALVTSISDADRGMIRGKVMILADERSNKLIIVTTKANMDFFDKVIEQLDVETTPDVKVEVIRLKYADAEEVSDMINDLIGNASGSKNSSKSAPSSASRSGSSGNLTRGTTTSASKPANQRSGESKAGELSKDNVTVLADKRINGLVIMARAEDFPALHQIIEAMDVKLAQVLIETVIVEVGLDDTIKTGVDWISGLKGDGTQAMTGGGGMNPTPRTDAQLATDALSLVPGGQGLGYFAHLKDLDISVVVQASKSDTRTKYLASPVVMTVDNKEATIDATTKQQFITGWQAVSSSYAGSGLPSPTYSSTDIGLKVKVKPKINPNGTVMLEVEEEYTQVAGKQDMLVPNTSGGNGSSYATQQVDIPTTRKMASDVLLENAQTIVFGGLIESKQSKSDAGIPILKDIPWIGRYLFGKVEDSEKRTELLVFMTPYVLDDGMAAEFEALRRKQALSDSEAWQDRGWSKSKLADPISAKEKLRRLVDEWERQDEEYATEKKIEDAKAKRAEALQDRKESGK